MTFEPPQRTKQLNASDLPSVSPPYLFKGLDDPDSEWHLVREIPIYRLRPTPDKDGFMPGEVTVYFADGAPARFFNPDDQVLIGSAK